ncbi:MAG: glutamate 5-kinase [Proteobacteria bacterium]|nr:glutamate 5-kinase [Pseudomonadota bacterium]
MNELQLRKETVRAAKRIIVKIGSAVLTHHTEIIDGKVIESLVDDMSVLLDEGKEIILVTSGAVAAGTKKLGLKGSPRSIPEKQAAAAAGQSTLIRYYERAFEKRGKKVAQILLTGDGLSDRTRYLNARNTITSLLYYSVVPIINENDTVVVDEIRFGDNDNLSAMVVGLSDADLLIMLTDTEGLYNKDPRKFDDVELIQTVRDIDSQTKGIAGGASDVGTGGMATKIEAARRAGTFGVPAIIANGGRKGVLLDVMNGVGLATLFVPREERLKGRKRWIAYNLKVSGTIIVDDGAKNALGRGKSLLPSGVVAVEGDFYFGDLVSLVLENGPEFARGLVQYSSNDIDASKGLNTSRLEEVLGKKDYDEIIHRDDLVLL